MSTRDEILKRLKASRTGHNQLADRTRRYPDLAERFRQALKANKGEVWLVADVHEAWQKAIDVLEAAGVQSIAAHRSELPPVEPTPDLKFNQFEWHFAGEDGYRQTCTHAGAGLTGADAALAETGTLVITSGQDRARITSLLPPLHIVFLHRSRLFSDIFAWKQLRPAQFPANLVFVSGPSKTADIEQALVVGVHGPRRLVVIVYS